MKYKYEMYRTTKKASYAYIDNAHQRWLLSLDGQNVQVFCDGESRTYTIPEPIINFEVEDEYCFIYVEGKTYQFKFEANKFLVGDIYRTSTGEFLNEFAMHVFGED